MSVTVVNETSPGIRASEERTNFVHKVKQALKPSKRNNYMLMTFILLCLSGYIMTIYESSYDNDIWFILASGREIMENGFPYLNPYSASYGDLPIIIQQWIPAVIAWGIFSFAGFPGLGIWLVICIWGLVVSLYFFGRLLRKDKAGGEIILAFAALALPAFASYLSMRPHVYTMIGFIWIMYFCEKYRQTNQWKYLIALPLLVLVHINFHMSMAVFDLVIIACFLIPDFMSWIHKTGYGLGFRFADGHYNRIPLLIAFGVSILALMINPYGISGALYLFSSYGAAEYADYIREMGYLIPWSDYGFFAVLLLVLGGIAIGSRGSKHIDFPYILLLAGTSILSFQHVRNVWLMVCFAFPLIILATKGISINWMQRYPVVYNSLSIIFVCFAVISTIIPAFSSANRLEEALYYDDPSTPSAAMDFLDDAGVDKETTTIFNFFNAGGYIEFRGYNVFIDARPEIWNSPITGADRDYYFEFVDMAINDTDILDAVEEYQFDFMVVNTDTILYENLVDPSTNPGYTSVLAGNGYELWAKNDLPYDIYNNEVNPGMVEDTSIIEIDSPENEDENGEVIIDTVTVSSDE